MKNEVSAGGIIVKKTHVLLLRDMSGSWTFPKGLVEKGETHLEAAMREIGEEVGLTHLEYMATVSPIKYSFRRGSLVHKIVHYFLFRFVGDEKIVCQKSEGIHEAKWYSFDEAILLVGYAKTNIPLLKQAQVLL